MSPKVYIAAGLLAVAFIAGWTANDWRWSAKYTELERDISTARADGEEAARKRLQAAYEKREQEHERAIKRERAAVTAQQERARDLERRRANIESKYREALTEPDCAAWDSMPIACPVGVHPELNEAGPGSDRDSGSDPMARSASGADVSLRDYYSTADNQRPDEGAMGPTAGRAGRLRW